MWEAIRCGTPVPSRRADADDCEGLTDDEPTSRRRLADLQIDFPFAILIPLDLQLRTREMYYGSTYEYDTMSTCIAFKKK